MRSGIGGDARRLLNGFAAKLKLQKQSKKTA